MLEKNVIKTQLSRAYCPRCGASLDSAKLVPITQMPLVLVAHVECLKCKSENMVTITSLGAGVVPLVSDLKSREIKKFAGLKSISYDEILKLHQKLEKEGLCNLKLK